MGETKICPLCGKEFTIVYRGWTRKFCFECSPPFDKHDVQAKDKSKTILKKAIKKYLVQYKGGKCIKCGYNACMEALHFHHLDPDQKDFAISKKSRDLEVLKQEVDKCALLCANCHSELHAGYWNIEDIDLG